MGEDGGVGDDNSKNVGSEGIQECLGENEDVNQTVVEEDVSKGK